MKTTRTRSGGPRRPSRPPILVSSAASKAKALKTLSASRTPQAQPASSRTPQAQPASSRAPQAHPAQAEKNGNGHGKSHAQSAVLAPRGKADLRLDRKLLLQIHDLMIKARVLEERLIRMYKKSDGYFWLGGPGEEAFAVPLGLQILKGQGLDYDMMHFHYRAGPTLVAMGAEPIDFMRQMKNTATDPFSGGRNFAAHASIRKWNVVPITSTIETQYATAIGGGVAHRRHGGKGITIVTGGDAGTAEGEFASCMVWASRPGFELPILMIVTNNRMGISTSYDTQHGESRISDRGKAFGIKTATINGLDVEESYLALKEAMDYVRKERKPFLLEARVSRMYGHSSATGANLVAGEEDPLITFEKKLEAAGLMTRKDMEELREKYNQQMLEQARQVIDEPMPDPSTIYDFTYCGQKGKYF
jgi:2-oxoisovalerate dehydrogenase E1 component alpha subunit